LNPKFVRLLKVEPLQKRAIAPEKSLVPWVLCVKVLGVHGPAG